MVVKMKNKIISISGLMLALIFSLRILWLDINIQRIEFIVTIIMMFFFLWIGYIFNKIGVDE